jgi:predicted nucleotidyltransferase
MNGIDIISARLLAVLAEDPRRELYQREIARLASVSIGATCQKLKKLSDNEMVSSRKAGKMIFYRYNLTNPVAKQFKLLLNLTAVFELTLKLRDHARQVILFGSYADGTNVTASAIDIFVLTGEGKKVREMARDYGDNQGKKVSLVIVDPGELQVLKSKYRPLYKRILRGITLCEAGKT